MMSGGMYAISLSYQAITELSFRLIASDFVPLKMSVTQENDLPLKKLQSKKSNWKLKMILIQTLLPAFYKN